MAKGQLVLLNINEWLTSTAGMDADCRGWYLNLLLHKQTQGELPDDIESIASIAGVKFSEYPRFEQVFKQVLKQVLEHLFEQILNKKNENCILRPYEPFKNKRSEAGKMSYLMKFFKKRYPKQFKNNELKNFLKKNINLQINLKSEKEVEQVFEQVFKVFINKSINSNLNKENTDIVELLNSKKEKKESNYFRRSEISEIQKNTAILHAEITLLRKYTHERISELWEGFLVETKSEIYQNENGQFKHFLRWLKFQPADKNLEKTNQNGRTKNTSGKTIVFDKA